MDQFGKCKMENKFGYNIGAPCVFLKLKKVRDWIPQIYNSSDELPSSMPSYLRNLILTNQNLVMIILKQVSFQKKLIWFLNSSDRIWFGCLVKEKMELI